METQRHRPLTPRKTLALSSVDNHIDISGQQQVLRQASFQDDNSFTYKNQTKSGVSMTLDDRIQKENRPPVYGRKTQTNSPSSGRNSSDYEFSNHNSFPNNSHSSVRKSISRKLEPSPRPPRPTTGGKTVSPALMNKINQPYNHHHATANNSDINKKNNNSDSNDSINKTSNCTVSNENKSNSNSDDSGDSRYHHHYHRHHHHHHRHHHHHSNPVPRQRIEQRMSAEQLKMLSRRIDPSLPASPRGSPSKPALPSIFAADEDQDDHERPCHLETFSSSLYQTCIDLWPSEPTLGDFASDNIKNLTDLLKVRLSQAKYRILAQLEDEQQQEQQGNAQKKMYPTISSAANILRDDVDYSTWPTFKKHKIVLSSKRSHVFASVSGNGKNLFRNRDAYLQQQRLQQHRHHCRHHRQQKQQRSAASVSLPPPPSSNQKKDNKRKRKPVVKKEPSAGITATHRIQASQLPPVVLENGSVAYVCKPCKKQYKTRNGLAYHLGRCIYQSEHSEDGTKANVSAQQLASVTATSPSCSPSTSSSKLSTVRCVCDNPTNDEGMMVQCDHCQSWLHLDCLGTSDAVLEDIYHCPRCTAEPLNKRARLETAPQQQEEMTLVFQHLNENTKSDLAQLPYSLTPSTNQLVPIPATDIESSSPQTSRQQGWDDFDLMDNMTSATTPIANTSSSANNDANIWGMSTADIPSLLYSDATAMTSTLDEDLPYLMDLPSSELSPHDFPPTEWFQFANFDDDFHCDDSQQTATQ